MKIQKKIIGIISVKFRLSKSFNRRFLNVRHQNHAIIYIRKIKLFSDAETTLETVSFAVMKFRKVFCIQLPKIDFREL